MLLSYKEILIFFYSSTKQNLTVFKKNETEFDCLDSSIFHGSSSISHGNPLPFCVEFVPFPQTGLAAAQIHFPMRRLPRSMREIRKAALGPPGQKGGICSVI